MHIRIGSANIWGLPWPFSVHKRKRIMLLAELIKKQRLDIACIQELWINYDIDYLAHLLPEYQLADERDVLYNPSGLAVFSKLPIGEIMYMPFNNRLFHKEFPSKKGLLSVDIRQENTVFKIINTHVYYTISSEQSKSQKQQLALLLSALDTRPTILCGDFNVHRDQLPLPSTYQLLSDPEAITYDKNTPYAKKRFNAVHAQVDRTPDMIFANFPVSVHEKSVITDPIISDHFPLIVDMDFSQTTEPFTHHSNWR